MISTLVWFIVIICALIALFLGYNVWRQVSTPGLSKRSQKVNSANNQRQIRYSQKVNPLDENKQIGHFQHINSPDARTVPRPSRKAYLGDEQTKIRHSQKINPTDENKQFGYFQNVNSADEQTKIGRKRINKVEPEDDRTIL